jgi:hypothetical protein
MNYKGFGAAIVLAALPLGVLAVAQTQTPPSTTQTAPSAATTEARVKVRAACAADFQKFCASVDRVKGARRECMQANEAQLSAPCKAARAERAAARAKEKS